MCHESLLPVGVVNPNRAGRLSLCKQPWWELQLGPAKPGREGKSMDVRVGTSSQSQPALALHTLGTQVDDYEEGIDRILISEEEIQEAIARLGKEITADYKGRDLLVIGVLKGA